MNCGAKTDLGSISRMFYQIQPFIKTTLTFLLVLHFKISNFRMCKLVTLISWNWWSEQELAESTYMDLTKTKICSTILWICCVLCIHCHVESDYVWIGHMKGSSGAPVPPSSPLRLGLWDNPGPIVVPCCAAGPCYSVTLNCCDNLNLHAPNIQLRFLINRFSRRKVLDIKGFMYYHLVN